jgi:DNA polymerase/3'-5' exonuclease PolX
VSTGLRLAWKEAYDIAARVARHLKPAFDEIKCVGSLRRKRPDVGDLEFVGRPFYEVDLACQRQPVLGIVRAALLDIGTWVKGGERMMQVTDVYGVEGLKLEVYIQHPLSCVQCSEPIDTSSEAIVKRGVCPCGAKSFVGSMWGSQVAIRTGPWQLGAHVMAECRRYEVRHKDGFAVDATRGYLIPTDSEKQFFALGQVPFVAPAERDALAEKLTKGR